MLITCKLQSSDNGRNLHLAQEWKYTKIWVGFGYTE